MRLTLPACLLASVVGVAAYAASGPGFAQPMRHGVVFWQAPTPDEAVRELERVKADGYTLIKLASWAWTLPAPGSDTERVARATLDWCDHNDFHFYLLQNIQYGSAGEGGGLDAAWENPLSAAPLLEDWVRVLRGHSSVRGVILGNEVSPIAGTPDADPKWWGGFTEAMRDRYGDIASLNEVWGTRFDAWDSLATPPPDSPGQVDLRRFATAVYERFYGTLFDEACRPALGDLEYGTKTAGDPILHRRLTRFSLLTWDDVLANYPQWRVKAMCDIGRALDRPVFNSELHLYHDTYAFNQSAEMARYRYFMSALNGETTTASFAWGQWSANPETAAIHAQTPGVLADLRALEGDLRLLASAEPTLHVLLTEHLTLGDDTSEDARPPAERIYAEVAALGLPWRFVCEGDVATVRTGTLLVPAVARPERATIDALAGLPPEVTLACEGGTRQLDCYGRRLPAESRAALAGRSRSVAAIAELGSPEAAPGPPYNRVGESSYLWWSAERGHFHGPVTYPVLEARRARLGDGWLVAVVNHATSGEPVVARLPWQAVGRRVVEELTGAAGPLADEATSFAPLSVRLFRYREAMPR